ncbi:MAG: EAL domain-containing protein [Gammaproteobacteria bacterium]
MAGAKSAIDNSAAGSLGYHSGERRFLRLWRTVLGVFLGGGLIVLLGFAIWSWQDTFEKQQAEIGGEAKLVADGVEAYLTGLGDDLPYLGEWLASQPRTVPAMYRALKAYQAHHPLVASMVLFAPDGRMIVNTARPAGAVLPDPRKHPAFGNSIRATLKISGIWIGRTQQGLVLKFWRIPVRYVVRDAAGRPLYILQASIPLTTLTREWPELRKLHGAAVGVVRTDGYHVARLPAPDPHTLYNKPMAGPLMQQLRAHPQEKVGSYTGRVQSDFTSRFGRFVRLRRFPLVAYISVPSRGVWLGWAESTAPFLGLGIFGLVGYVGLSTLFLRRERRHLRELAERARREPVTGLPNRLAVQEWLDEALADKAPLSILQFNIDDFNDINDALGGPAGDRVLDLAAQRLRVGVQDPNAIVAHLGADEFLVGLPATDASQAQDVARRLQRTLTAPIAVEDRTVRVQASVGVGLYPEDGRTATDLMRAAATAVHVAKRSGRSQVAFYDPGASRQSEARVAFHHAIERALTRGEFLLYYQPVVAMDTCEIIGAEGLIRWQDPERGLLAPVRFIPLAEATGWIGAIGEWVLHRGCEDLRLWHKQGLDLRVSVNVSASQFNDSDFVGKLHRQLEAQGIQKDQLTLEVTETTVMHDVQHSAEIMKALTDIGVSLAIDDFGTGYSSLAYMRRLPVRAIKVDRSFVSEIETNPEGLAIVRAVVALARVFGCITVAEGIETESQYRLLRSVGVTLGQGYWFGRPMPEHEFRALAARGGALRAAAQN